MPTLQRFISTLLFASVVLNASTLLHIFYASGSPPLNHADAPFASELPLTVDHAVLQFHRDDGTYDLAQDLHWEALLPAHGGRVKLGSGSESPLQAFEVALFNDLACLDTIRRALAQMRNGSHRVTSVEAERCFGQLRQVVECMADTALEPAIMGCDAEGVCGPGASGHGVDHRCRDSAQVRRFVEDNQAGWGVV